MTESTSKRRLRIPSGSLLLLVALGLGVAMLAPTIQQVIGQQQRIAALETSIATNQAQLDQLQAAEGRWNDPAFIRSQARGRLMFVMPGDTSYLVLGGTSQPVADTQDVATDQHETKSDPLDLYLDSMVRAANPDSPAATAPAGTAPSETPAP